MRIGIIGLGALGSSLGLALRAQPGWQDITGYEQSARVQNEAKRRGAIREGTHDIPDLLSDADLVVLAIPPQAVLDFLRQHGPLLRAGTVVTDLAATKGEILAAAARQVAARSGFVGGHPIVGAEPGIEHAEAGLFRGRPWCLATVAGMPQDRVAAVSALAEAAGALPYFVDAAEHDAWTAAVEGLPRLIAAALARLAGESDAWRELARVAGRPLKDATRAAVGQAGRDQTLTNGEALVSWLDRLQVELDQWREAVAEGRAEDLDRRFTEAAAVQGRWAEERGKEARQRA